MTRLRTSLWCCGMLLCFWAGYLASPGPSQAQQPATGAAPAAATQPAAMYTRMPLAPDQREARHWTSADMTKAHTELVARVAKGTRTGGNPPDLFPPLLTRTHSMIMVHRPQLAAGATPGSELHEGVTDFYVIIGGSGTVKVGGQMQDVRTPRPGEFLGGAIQGGREFKVKAGDFVNIPPNMSHATVPDAGGMTYALLKVNVGLYPWSLINGTP